MVLQDLGFRLNQKTVLYLQTKVLKFKNWEWLSPNLAKPQNVSGHISKENRPTQELFKCVKCGHSGNADLEASITILNRI